MDVGRWLRGLGLGQYETNFRDNKIDADLLPRLTNDDLKDVGVSALGDRRRLLDAIAALAGAKPPAEAPASPSKAAPTKGHEISAERRPITVMFCDLVGSTSLAAKLDAEDWRNLVSAYLDGASQAVTGFGGHVLKRLGDGLMALFGYPHAQENDAERAVRAALAIQRALGELNARNAGTRAPPLVARIGLESGPVVVDATGEVFGEAPNVAARVQGAAEPGAILVTAAVQRQTAGLFVAEDLGARELKGVSELVTLYRIVRASGGGRRGGARALTPLVGRAEELDILSRRWERARSGEGQLALVVGEPGIGKSRLIEEFRARLGETPHTWVEWSSSQLLQNTPLHPIAEWGRLRFGADLPAEQRLADLENTLRLIGLDAAEYAPLIAPLVDVPLPEDRRAKFAPEEMRRRQLAALVAWFLAGARSQPVVLAFEDLHWADPTSLDLMQTLAERGAQAPLFLVATTRPEFRPSWSLRPHHSVMSLAPLDRAEVARMVGEISARHALARDVVEGVNERTGGVPLFVEEVTRLLLERGVEGGAQAIPPTLQQSLAARLDRLGAAREIAQIGAVLGRGFPHALLQALADLDEGGLRSAVERLAEADILFVEGDGAQATCRFKHALIQDAAYESLLKSRRQALHRRAAEALLAAGAEPEAIAHHFTEAGLDDLAIEWWGKAGDQALRRSAFQEAISHLGKAIAMADRTGSTAPRATGGSAAPSRRLTQLNIAYGNALFAARGPAAPETTEAFARVRESASSDKDAPDRLAADYGLWVGSHLRGDLLSMRAHAEAFLEDVENRPDSPEAGVAHRAAGLTRWFAGEYIEARDHLERALALFQPGRDNDLAFRFGLDPGVAAMTHLAMVSWPLGEVDRAVSLIDGMQTRIVGISHVGTLGFGRMHAALFHLMWGDPSRVAPNAFELAHLAQDHDLDMWRGGAEFLQGWATAASGAPGDGLEGMRRGVELLREQNVVVHDGLVKIALAEGEARAGAADRAVAILDKALATSDRLGFRAFEAELHRARGEMLLRRDRASFAPAEEAFQAAIAVARQQGTRSFELRAALALAKLWQSTNRPVEAHAALAPALEGFAPTPAMPEIAEAQALLTALAGNEEVKADAARRQRLTQLHAAYGNALFAARGPAAPETTKAFAKARESASDDKDASGRLAADYGLWVGSYARGDLPSMRAHAAVFLSDVEARPDSPEACVAHRAAGLTCWFAGEYRDAHDHLERALSLFRPGRDDDLAFRFGWDPGVAAMASHAFASWPLGDVDRGISLIDGMQTRAAGLNHVGTLAFGRMYLALFELMRGDHARAAPNAFELARLAHEHELPMWRAFGVFLEGWATAVRGAPGIGLDDMRRGVQLLREQNATTFDGLVKMTLAEAEARAGDPDCAVAILDEELATADRTGYRAFEAELHRVRGESLLRRDPASFAPVEEAFQAAIAVAKRQATRSFELSAALALAKLCQSTNRPVEAHAVLAPALEGFAPTPAMPEIAEAQALLAALADNEEVKADAARRQQLTQLHVAYGNALFAARGYGAPETTEAFARARNSASGDKDAPERLAADYGLWVGSYVRGELPSMRARAAAFLNDTEARPNSPEAGVALRGAGTTCWFAGEYREARDHFERALALFQPGRDDDLAFRLGVDPGVAAMAYMAIALWPLGEVDRAISLIDRMQTRVASLTHVGTLVFARINSVMFELMSGDLLRVGAHASEHMRLAREHDLSNMERAFGLFLEGWATAASGAPGDGLQDMRRSAEHLREQNVLIFDGQLKIALAEAEARAGDCDRAVAILDEALATADRLGYRAFEAELHRTRGEMLLQLDPASLAPAEEAFRTAIAVAKRQATRSFELRAALALAKLYQSTNRPVEAHAALAPALEGFAPTPAMPEIGEAQALLTALADNEEVKADAARRQRLTQLNIAYGNALIAARGYGAQETTDAFAKALESASGDRGAPERLAADYGLWVGSFTRGELPSMWAHAAAFLSDVEANPDSPEAGVAHRADGLTYWFAGEYRDARDRLERALALFQPGRDDDLAFRFGLDPGVAAMVDLALALWPLGEVDRAVSLIDGMQTRMADLAHVGTLAFGRMHAAAFELLRGDHARAASNAFELTRLAQDHDLNTWRAYGVFLQGWATAASGAPADGLEDMRRGAELLREQNVLMYDGLLKIALAEAEARAGDADRAIAILDEELATADHLGYRAFEAELHRTRGEILLKRDPASLAPAEEAFQTAIAVAKQQATRSFELRAALALAKLYQSAARPAEAHAVLASALEGFSPTPAMPEIAEAQALLAELAESDDVKNAAASRQRRLQLQTSLGRAMMHSRGYASDEARAAFARARTLAAAAGDAGERFDADYGLIAASILRGELSLARETAESFLREAENAGRMMEAAVARRCVGTARLWQGDFIDARTNLAEALATYDPERDRDAKFRFSADTAAAAAAYLTLAIWALGDVERARALSEEALARADETVHAPTRAFVYNFISRYQMLRGDPEDVRRTAKTYVDLGREHGMALILVAGEVVSSWARARLGDREGGMIRLEALAAYLGQGNKLQAPLFQGLLAELEAEGDDAEAALTQIDEALALANETGEHWTDALLHRIRGAILLKRDPAGPAPAEEAFRTAIAVAKQQGARSFELRAALALAKLCQSTNRPVEAHAVLAPALDGFSPTPEMPEIAEAQALMESLA